MARKARGDATIGKHTEKFRKQLGLSDRYEVRVVDTKNRNRQVRSDAALGSIRKKDDD